MPMAIVIRDSKCADAGALAAIAVAAWRPIRRRQAEALGAQQFSLQHRDWEEAKAAKVREACAPNFAGSVLVATAADSGVAVGFVSFGPLEWQKPEHARAPIGELWNNAVLPEFQRRGVATQLYTAALARMTDGGMGHVLVGVGAGNVPACRAYEKVGFVRCAEPADQQYCRCDLPRPVATKVAAVFPEHGTPLARLRTYVLVCGYILALKTVRAAIPSLVPILGAELGFTDAELAANLSTFFVGYTAFQVPGSVVAQRYGGKGVLTASMAGSAVVFGLLPAAAQQWRAAGSAGALFAAGVVQSFFTPGLAQINQDWLPAGSVWQVWAMRAQTLCGDALVSMTAAVLTPALCLAGGWRFACFFYAGLTAATSLVWQLAARARPEKAAAAVRGPVGRPVGAAAGRQEEEEKKAVEWGIFRLVSPPPCACPVSLHRRSVRAASPSQVSVQALIAFWVSSGFSQMNLTQLAPLCFADRFGLGPLQAGRCIATAMAVNIPGNLLTGALESWLLRRKVGVVAIRKAFTRVAAIGTAVASLLYGSARSPGQATACMALYYLSHQFNNSGAVGKGPLCPPRPAPPPHAANTAVRRILPELP